MTGPCLTLDSVCFVLPDGRPLFTHLSAQFDQQPTGLVGRNGVGKSMLARILVGQLQPASGRCLRSGRVHYLAQQANGACVAELAGVQTVLEALQRIEAGSTAIEDFDAVGERWDIRQRLEQALQSVGLGHLQATTPASELSGGQAMRVALLGAMLSQADFLILDEPSNHLDASSRAALNEQLQRWPGGLLVISHDRQLLGAMQRIVELTPSGLHSYGGDYPHYVRCKAAEQHGAEQHLQQRRQELKRGQQALREQQQCQQRRQAQGQRQGREANQARILLGRQKQRSEQSAGRQQQRQLDETARLAANVREAARQLDDERLINLHVPPVDTPPQRWVAELLDVELAHVPVRQQINLALRSGQRLAISGPNGCGKSSLLRLLAGQQAPLAGHCRVSVASVLLDQPLSLLLPHRSVLEQLQALNRREPQAVLRMRLAQLGLDAQQILMPSARLSGGEQVKAALALALYAETPAQLLLLDEPGNHLDLPSLQALEAMLRAYTGTLVVVSHDPVFKAALALDSEFMASTDGWQMG